MKEHENLVNKYLLITDYDEKMALPAVHAIYDP